MDRAASVPVGPGNKLFDDFVRYDSDPLDILEGRSVRKPQSEAAINPTRYRSVSRKSFGSLYRASRSVAGDLWRDSAVSDCVSDLHGFDNLRELCGSEDEIYLDCDDLNFVKVVGQGAFAGPLYQTRRCSLPVERSRKHGPPDARAPVGPFLRAARAKLFQLFFVPQCLGHHTHTA